MTAAGGKKMNNFSFSESNVSFELMKITSEITDDFELRLFIEEICCNLCRFSHVHRHYVRPEQIQINQEVFLNVPGAFADIFVRSPETPAYFIEVKYGYSPERIIQSMARKYGNEAASHLEVSRIVLVADTHRHEDWA